MAVSPSAHGAIGYLENDADRADTRYWLMAATEMRWMTAMILVESY